MAVITSLIHATKTGLNDYFGTTIAAHRYITIYLTERYGCSLPGLRKRNGDGLNIFLSKAKEALKEDGRYD